MDITSIMPFPDLLQRLARSRIRLWLEGGQLRYSAPKGAPMSELLPSLREHKAELTGLLGADADTPSRIGPAPDADTGAASVSLSSMQRGMVDVYPTLDSAHYLHPTVASVFEGVLDLDALRASLNTLMVRHSALRSRFVVSENGERTTLIESQIECDLRHLHIGDCAAEAGAGPRAGVALSAQDQLTAAADEAGRRFLRSVVTERFDLSHAPLIRVGVVTLTPAIHALVVVTHHAIMDGLSLDVLLGELASLYAGFLQGQPARLEPVKLQFSDFVRHEREWLQGPQAQAARQYWVKRLHGLRAPFELPSAPYGSSDTAPSHPPLRGEISTDVTQALRKIAREESTTFRSAALAAFMALLGRWRDSSEACTWVCHSGRAHLELYQTVGCFYNLWLLRVQLGADPTFVQLLRQVRDAHLEALPWLELPFTEIGELLGNPRTHIIFSHLMDDSGARAARAAFQGSGSAGAGLTADRARAEALIQAVPAVAHLEENSRQTFSLACVERPGGLTWGVLHAPSLVDCATMASMSGAYAGILASVAGNPALRVSELPFTPPATSRHQH